MKEGTKFGPYELIKRVGVGGMAEVYMAKTSGIGGFEKVLALKVIHPNYAADEDFVDMLVDEAKLCVQLTHRNIAQVFDLGFVDGRYFIAMEFIDGKDLYQLMIKCAASSMPVPFDLVAYVGTEMANGLHYAHARSDNYGRPLNLIHRDVSPQNVLISHEGDVKLVDFGIAKANQRRQQTDAGVIKGKFCYMSPEQAWGEELDARSDVFACGICLYEMVSGQMLFMDGSALELLDKVRRADIPPLSSLRKDIPPELERIIHRALARDRDDRYMSAAEMQADLANFLHQNWPRFSSRQLGGFIRTVFGDQRFVLPEPEEQPRRKKLESTVEIMRAAEFDRSGAHSVIFDLAKERRKNSGAPFEEREDPTIASDFTPMLGDLKRDGLPNTTQPVDSRSPDSTRLLPELGELDELADSDQADRTAILSEMALENPMSGSEKTGSMQTQDPDEELEGPTIVFDSSVVARAISQAPAARAPVAQTHPMGKPVVGLQNTTSESHVTTNHLSHAPQPGTSEDDDPTAYSSLPETPQVEDKTQSSPFENRRMAVGHVAEKSKPSQPVSEPRRARAEPRNPAGVPKGRQGPIQLNDNDAESFISKLLTVRGISILATLILGVYALATLLPGFLAEPVRDRAWLLVESTPPGARVIIDGKDTGKLTNARVQELKLGQKHQVQLELASHATHAAYIRLDENNTGGSPLTGTYRVTLKHTGTQLQISTTPEGADIYVDGLYLGTSPVLKKDLPRKADTALILIQKKGFIDQNKRIPWSESKRIQLDLPLMKRSP